MRRRGRIVLAAAALAAAALCLCLGLGQRQQHPVPELVLTYAENQTEDYPTTLGAKYFAELVEARTEGRILIQVKANAELGDERSAMEQLQLGGLDMMRISLMTLSDLSPKLAVLLMPYLYEDEAHMWRVLDGETGDEMMAELGQFGLQGLSWYDAGARSFYSAKEPIRGLEDLAGKRIRVQQSRLMEAIVRALGAEPVPTVYEAVYSGLQTGNMDAAENNWPSYEAMHHNEVARYFYEDEHVRAPELQLISAYIWEKLDEADRQILLECAHESSLYQRRLWEERSDEAKKRCLEAGTVLTTPDEGELGRLRQAVQPIYAQYGRGYEALIERIRRS